MRILTATSRKWPQQGYGKISYSLIAAIEHCHKKNPNDKKIVIVHGNCPSRIDKVTGVYYGVDQYMVEWVNKNEKAFRSLGFDLSHEPHSARTDLYGSPAAFHKRNQHMVDLGADYGCFFIVKDKSNGTIGTMKRAQAAKIEVQDYYFGD